MGAVQFAPSFGCDASGNATRSEVTGGFSRCLDGERTVLDKSPKDLLPGSIFGFLEEVGGDLLLEAAAAVGGSLVMLARIKPFRRLLRQ